MKPTDADRLDKLAKAYGTNANHCRHMAEPARNRSSKEDWVRLEAVWTTLAAEAEARSRWTELASH